MDAHPGSADAGRDAEVKVLEPNVAEARTFTLNGQPIEARVDGKKSLLRYLRDDLGMMGTKDGCSSGDCGSCVVLVDGKPVDACVYLMRRANGVSIETIEGLSEPEGRLHPIQAAYLANGGTQCGFCTPGFIMATKALLEKNPNPTEQEIREGLKDNICRCTGYLQIFEAVQQAGEWIQDPAAYESWKPKFGGLGAPAVLIDGHRSVRGRLTYADDMVMPGMLYGSVVWAEHAYARILGLDVAAAAKAEGVHRVVTAADVPGLNLHGILIQDQPVLCHDMVRFWGDPVAVVLADTKEHADAAAQLVKVDYEPIPGLFTMGDAMAEGAPQINKTGPGNVCQHLEHKVGDVDAAFATAAHIVEGTYRTGRQDHAYLEPLVSLAEVTPEGGITVWSPTQAPFETREQLAKILDIPKEKVRVVSTPIGGGFGGKCDIAVEGLVAVSAWASGRPVKITLSRAESLQTGAKRHPFELHYRVATDAEGYLQAVDAELLMDGGPYSGHSQRVIDQACIFSTGPYRVPNVRIDGKAVMTNNPLGGPFRGFGINQAAVAMETLLDELAIKLDMDPFELRRKNMFVEGDTTISGQWLTSSVGALGTLEACQAGFDEVWQTFKAMARPGYRVGYGIASAYKNVGAGKGRVDDAGAILRLKPDGRVELRSSVVDMGEAIRTTMVQLASQATGLDFETFDVITGDTALTHPHREGVGQRQTLIAGKAAVLGGEQFRARLIELVSGWSGRDAEDLTVAENQIRSVATNETMCTLPELYARAATEGIDVEADVIYVSPKTYSMADDEARRTVPREQYRNYPIYNYATHVAFVGVDEATGRVDLLRVIAAHDCGVPINPLQIRGQLIGSVSMGQGYALSEDYPTVNGRPPWRRIDYRKLGVPTSLNAASVRVEVVEDPFPEGPYGAKGISETATVPSTPAILNAIYNATGVRVSEIPVDSKRLAEAIAGRGPSRVAPQATVFERSRTASSSVGRSGPWQELDFKA
jgi:CO/xanthine dehydrogenase Mo-binding subunit/aerobic-type carbon monoxide dehydrogenase small subunit (CoxS/CutS family)